MNKKKIIIISSFLVVFLVITLILTRPNLRKLLGSVNLLNLKAIDVPYTNNSQSNVQGAIDDLTTKIDSFECKEGYTKGTTTSNGGYRCEQTTQASFATSSWAAIIEDYTLGRTTNLQADMAAGTTRNVDLGDLGVHPVRIANLKHCSEVSVESKTACGLVIEFADIITTHRMNPFNEGDTVGTGNYGGWELSDMRAYLNSTTYTYENTNYSTTGIYNKIPTELRSKIIDTTVVSGHNNLSGSSNNFTTTDKLYLLSTHEIWEDITGTNYGIDDYDTAYSSTRQLDYYIAKAVTTSNYSGAIKKINGTNSDWWLRTASSNYGNGFYLVSSDGNNSRYYRNNELYGVSPAFRLAE